MRKINWLTTGFFIGSLLWCGSVWSQPDALPFAQEIQAFKKEDSLRFPPPNQILFIGSSSFTRWTDVQAAFPGYPILNRGFGGSTLPDVIRYAPAILFPYRPKQIVIYCGENDLAFSDTVTAATVLSRFKTLFTMIRAQYKTVPVVFVSFKPSPSRWHIRDRMMKGNELIRNYLKKQRHTKFVSVWKAMLGPDGKPLSSLFVEDNLHMNEKGYAIWQRLLAPHLIC